MDNRSDLVFDELSSDVIGLLVDNEIVERFKDETKTAGFWLAYKP